MDLLWEACLEAFGLILAGDPYVAGAAWRSVWISTAAVALAAAVGLPLGIGLARRPFPGNRLVVLVLRAGMALPTVFVGMVCYALFSRRGPLGPAELLYSPWGVVCGEFCLALPIVAGLMHGAVGSLDPRAGETARTLGAGPWQRGFTYLSEARTGVLLALLTALARCVTELGIAMIVGGNLKDRTRTLATATALETSRGEFARGLAMGSILLVIALAAAAIMARLTREHETRRRPTIGVTSMSTAMIHVEKLQVVRGAQTVCSVERLVASPGERIAVLGPNGSGKTTLLRIVAGLEFDYQGCCRVDAARRELTYVHQQPYLFRGDVLSNVAYGLRARRTEQTAAARTAHRWLDRLGLAGLATRDAATLSGGERRRVAIARALALAPRLLLLDEPLAELDDASSALVRAALSDVEAALIIASPTQLPDDMADSAITL